MNKKLAKTVFMIVVFFGGLSGCLGVTDGSYTPTPSANHENLQPQLKGTNTPQPTMPVLMESPVNPPENEIPPLDEVVSKIVYYSEENGNVDIYITDLKGTVTQLTNHPEVDWKPVWSPDGTRIVFTSLRNGNPNLYVINADGTELTQLSGNHLYFDEDPVWSPDGSKIAYVSTQNKQYELCIVDANGANLKCPTEVLEGNVDMYESQSWSPDGSKIVFLLHKKDGGVNLYIVDVDDGSLTNLTELSGETGFGPSWSPDGDKIAYYLPDGGGANLYIMNVGGSNPIQLTDDFNIIYPPVWSPDGSKIAFVSGELYYSGHIYVVDADGRNLRTLTSEIPYEENWDPVWSPDGEMISYKSDDGVYIAAVDGSWKTLLPIWGEVLWVQ